MKKTWVKILVIGLAAAVLIAGAIILAVVLRKDEVKRSEHSIVYFYEDAAGATRFFCDDKLLEHQISGAVESFVSCDGSVGLAKAGTGLYRVDPDGVLMIYPVGVVCEALSLNNRVIVFSTATEVHIYDHDTGKLEDIKPEGITGVPAVAVSEDGSTVAYTVKTADGRYEAYVHENGASRKLADNAYVLAVSPKAGIAWFADPSSSSLYFVRNCGKPKKVCENVSGLVEFNKGLTEAMFDVAGVTHYSVRGAKPKPIVNGASVYTTKPECSSLQGGDAMAGSVADCTTLFGGVFYSSFTSSSDSSKTVYDLYYVDRSHKVTELVKGASSFSFTEDRKKLACIVDKSLYLMGCDDPGTAKVLAENVYSYCMTGGAEKFYLVGFDLTLCYLTPGNAPEKIASNVSRAVIAGDGKCLFVADYDESAGAGKLMLADGTSEPVTVLESVSHFESMQKLFFAYSKIYENEYASSVFDVYTSPNGESFSLALKGARKNSVKN